MKFSPILLLFFILLNPFSLTQTLYGQADRMLLPIQENKLWGFIDTKGNIVIKPQFKSVSGFSEGLAIVQLEIAGIRESASGKGTYKPSRFGFIDETGQVTLRPPYDAVGEFVEGMAPVRIGDRFDGKYLWDGKWGFINKSGELVVGPQFDSVINSFSDGLAPVMIGKKWGFVNLSRKIVIPPRFDQVEEFSDDLAAVEVGRKWGFIDKNGAIVIRPQFSRAWRFGDGLAAVQVRDGGKWGFINQNGRLVISPKYEYAGEFADGKAFLNEIRKGTYERFCSNRQGEELPLEECASAFPVSKFVNGKSVFVDESGKVLFENKWDMATEFRNGIALVYNFNKAKYWCGLYVPDWVGITDMCCYWGYIDKTGHYVWKNPELK